eukprot:m.94624 g.94624  ORF g.94624 m.94624 type:complete len:138 (+) comp16554_c0_seq3:382-795(+)
MQINSHTSIFHIPIVFHQVGDTPLHCAAHRGHDSTALELLSHEASIHAPTNMGSTPLHYAAYQGHDVTVSLFLRHNANIQAKTTSGDTPLHCAAYQGHGETVSLLLNHNANIHATNNVSVCTRPCIRLLFVPHPRDR